MLACVSSRSVPRTIINSTVDIWSLQALTPVILRDPEAPASLQSCYAVEMLPQLQTRLGVDVRATKMGPSRAGTLAIFPGRFYLSALKVAKGE